MKAGPVADAVLLDHMLQCVERIREYTRNERDTFMASALVQDAVMRKLHTLTESSQRLSAAVKEATPEVAWRELAGFRNVIVHGYLGVDLDATWLVVEHDLPPLESALRRLGGSADG